MKMAKDADFIFTGLIVSSLHFIIGEVVVLPSEESGNVLSNLDFENGFSDWEHTNMNLLKSPMIGYWKRCQIATER